MKLTETEKEREKIENKLIYNYYIFYINHSQEKKNYL